MFLCFAACIFSSWFWTAKGKGSIEKFRPIFSGRGESIDASTFFNQSKPKFQKWCHKKDNTASPKTPHNTEHEGPSAAPVFCRVSSTHSICVRVVSERRGTDVLSRHSRDSVLGASQGNVQRLAHEKYHQPSVIGGKSTIIVL